MRGPIAVFPILAMWVVTGCAAQAAAESGTPQLASSITPTDGSATSTIIPGEPSLRAVTQLPPTLTPMPGSLPQVVTTLPPVVASSTPTFTSVPPAILTTPPSSSGMPCGYQWAYKALPDLDTKAEQALATLAGQVLDVRVYDFGEACAPWDGVSPFGVMETDFDVTVSVADAKNLDQVGALALSIIQALEPLLGQGTARGVIRLVIGDASATQPMVRISQQQVSEIKAQNLAGAALMTYLSYNPQ